MSFYTTNECVDYICDSILIPNLATLTPQPQAVYRLDDQLLPGGWPMVVVVDNGLRRTYGGSHRFTLIIGVQIAVLHGPMNEPVAQRSKEDLALARQITLLLHADRMLGGNIAQGWVERDQAHGVKFGSIDDTVKTTLLNWVGEQVELDTT